MIMARQTAKARVQAHRTGLRRRGLRPIQLWVPDTRAPGFAEEAARQSRLVDATADAAEMMALLEQVSAFDEDDATR